tara:strand:- start:240 stop:1682 length:1443 start_codon:yes stop_codon:yes gene_type:complete
MAILVFNHYTKQITVASPGITLDIQELYNKCKTEESFPNIAMTQGVIITAAGKEPLGGGVIVGITATMRNGWTVGFEARGTPTAVEVIGGNLVAESGIVGDQFFQTTNIQIQYQSSSSATIAGNQSIENIEHHIERDKYAFGETYYWNPVNGNDLDSGISAGTSRKTFASIQADLIVSGNNDVVYCVTPGVDGIIIITEKIDITKNNVHLRGQGNRHVIAPTEQGDAVRISGFSSSPILGVEFSGFTVEVPTIGDNLDGIANDGNQANIHLHWAFNAHIHNVHVINGQTNGIQMHFSQNVIFDNLDIYENAGDGMFIWNSKNSQVNDCRIFNNAADGIKIQADSEWEGTPIPEWRVDNIIFHETKVYNNDGYSLDFVASGTTPTEILFDSSSWIGYSTLGRANTNDLDRSDIHDNDMVTKLDNINGFNTNDQEWVTPGLLKIYTTAGLAGGVTLHEFETRDSSGVQTFILSDVKQYIKVK